MSEAKYNNFVEITILRYILKIGWNEESFKVGTTCLLIMVLALLATAQILR